MSLRRTCLPAVFFIPVCLLTCVYSSAQKDSSIKKDHLLVLPVIARSIETSWSFGAAISKTFHVDKKDSISRTSNLQSVTLYSLEKQFVAAVNGVVYFPQEKYILTGQLSYSFFPDKFWGLGKMAPDSNEENYKFRQFYIYLHGQRALARHFFIGVLFEYQRVAKIEYTPGGLFDKENIPGRHGYQVAGLGASLTYDTRNDAFAPDKGIFIQGYFNHFDDYLGSDFTYTNYVVDARRFIKTSKKQVLALQAFASINDGKVPLRSMASFGGAHSMRGYYGGRYRDKNQLVVQAEYRVGLFWRLGAVVFGGMGNVSSNCDYRNVKDFKYAYGTGLRFALTKTEKLNLRLDYGVSGGKSRGFYFQLGEAF